MNINSFKNKSIYLAPYNNVSKLTYNYLSSNINFNFLGYIDKSKKGKEIKSNKDIKKDFDYVIISSPFYHKIISSNIIHNGINKSKLIYAHYKITDCSNFYFFKLPYFYNIYSYINYKFSQIFLLKLSDIISIVKLRNKHLNKKAFIICNGPSLSTKELDLIKNEISFASNKIYLSFDETQWRPTYYFVTDGLVYSQNYETISQLKLKKFFSNHLISIKKRIKGSTYFPLNFKHPANFNTNPLFNLYSGSTVTFVMLEFAVYMGIKEIFLMGLDFHFELPDAISGKEISSEGEVNHFHKDYRKKGEKWTKPDLNHQRTAFLEAKKFCARHDIKIYNISRNTKLDVFDHLDFEHILGNHIK